MIDVQSKNDRRVDRWGKADTEMNQTVGERIIKRAVWKGGGRGGEGGGYLFCENVFVPERGFCCNTATGLKPLQAVT